MAAHPSSSLSLSQKTTGEGTIQICCSWGEQIADGILTYKINDGANSQVVKAVHQAIDEWNSKVPNIKFQEITDNNTPADIDIKTNSKAQQLTHDQKKYPTSTTRRSSNQLYPQELLEVQLAHLN
jgi:hypothetical protein